MSQRKELPLVKRRIEALLLKTEANGCTAGEAAAALEKAEELVAKYEFDPGSFRWPPRPSTQFGSADIRPERAEAATELRCEPGKGRRQACRAADRRASRLDLRSGRR